MPISPSYWTYFNKADSLYHQNKFIEAKKQLLNLLDSEKYSGYFPLLLKIYRRITQEELDHGELEEAVTTYDEFFKVCEGYTTNTDNRNYNKLIDLITNTHPNFEKSRRAIEKTEQSPEYSISTKTLGKIIYLGSKRSIPPGQAPRGIYYQNIHFKDSCWYIKNHYDDANPEHAYATIHKTSICGDPQGEINLNHLVYKINKASDVDIFAIISFDLTLYLYSRGLSDPKKYDLSKHTNDRYSVGCLSLSAKGDNIYVTISDELFSFDNNLKIINSYKVPNKKLHNSQSEEKPIISQSKEITRALQQLGIIGNPLLKEIKTAFNKKIREVHPDLHPNDIQANDKTREVIAVYQLLSLKYDPDALKNQNIIIEIRKGISINIFLSYGDNIRAVHILNDNKGILVGCYSGRVYLFQNDSTFDYYFESKLSVSSIQECGEFIYCINRDNIYIFRNQKKSNQVPNNGGFNKLIFSENGFLSLSTRQIKLFALDGMPIGIINTKNNISDAYFTGDNLSVITAKKIFSFSIQSNVQYLP
jgi:hypothetical protein